MTFPPKVWDGVLRRLEAQLPPHTYEAWLAPLEAVFDEHGVAIRCPSPFHRERVRSQLLDSIREAFAQELDRSVPVELEHEPGGTERAAEPRASRPGMRRVSASPRESALGEIPVAAEAGRPAGVPSLVPGEPLRIERPRDGRDAQRAGSSDEPLPATMARAPIANPPAEVAATPPVPRLPVQQGPPVREGAPPAQQGAPLAQQGAPLAQQGAPLAQQGAPPRADASLQEGTSRDPGASPETVVPVSPARLRVLPPVVAPHGETGHAQRPPHGAQTPARTLRAGTDPRAAFSQAPSATTTATPRGRAPASAGAFAHTFDSFVSSACNQLPSAAAHAVALGSQPGLQLVYLHGGPGVGKSHLARAAARAARDRSGRGVRCVSAETFTNEFLSAIRSKETTRFKARYRARCEMLVVDDIHFFAGKDSTQTEFFHTLQHVLDHGGRVIVTADRPLSQLAEMANLDARLREQLQRALVAELTPPDATLRREILRSKAAAGGNRIPEACLDLLVDQVRGNVRELEGVLVQLVSTASLLKRPIDLALTREAVERKLGSATAAPTRPSTDLVIGVVASFFETSRTAMASRSRRRDTLVPRQLAMYLCRKYTEASLAEIGRELGREHPAVKNAVERVEKAMLEKAPLRYQVEALSRRLDELMTDEKPEGA